MITLSTAAQAKIQSLLSKRPEMIGIKIGVRTTGCSGYAYTLEYAVSTTDDVTEYTFDTVRIFVEKKYELMLHGMNVDYVREGLNEGFKFVNPNERDRCGCGASFRV